MRQKRVLLFVHDGSGLGHLRRIARIAEAIQGRCAALVVTGLRQATWMVPENCEVLRLPSWHGLNPERARYWDRPVWLRLPHAEAKRLRSDLLASATAAFSPDFILSDYLPFGQSGELAAALRGSAARKYLILRGIVDTSDRQILCGDGARILGETYDGIVVTADPRMVDVVAECGLDAKTAAKVTYVGYVAPAAVDQARIRQDRGLPDRRPCVVCSGGGGMRAEAFLQHCVALAASMPQAEFDVVFGPLSNSRLAQQVRAPANCRITRECRNLAEWHAASDIVVTTGGYNSVMEAAIGGARILVCPNQSGSDDEQATNALRLSRYYPVRLVQELSELAGALRDALAATGQARPAFGLDTGGADRIRELLLDRPFTHAMPTM